MNWHARNRFWLCILIAWFIAAGGASLAQAGENDAHVLLLNSYHYGMDWADGEMAGVTEVIKKAPRHVELHVEFMDTKRASNPSHFANLRQTFGDKYRSTKFDAILTTDNDAFNFLRQYRNELFPGVPIVFCGVNFFRDDMLAGMKGYTGVAETFEGGATLALMLRLHPKTQRVVVVIDSTTTGKAIMADLAPMIAPYRQKVEFEFWDNQTIDAVRRQLTALKPGTLVLLMPFARDSAGTFVTYPEIAKMVSESSPVPVYGTWDFYMGYGIVGGRLTNAKAQGMAAGDLLLRVLNGESADSIPIQRVAPSHYIFDYRQLERYGIPKSVLPEGSSVLFQPWREENKRLIWSGALLLLVVVTLVWGLLTAQVRRNQAVQALRKSEAKYRELVENANSIVLHWDASGKITYFNEYAQQFFGFSADEIIGRDVIGTIVPATDSVGNDLAKMTRDILSDPRQFAHNENENMRKDGSRVWISWANRAVLDSAGRCVEILSIGNDITRLKQFEVSLRRSKEQFEAILNATTESIFLSDCNGKILAINATAAQRLNKEPAELIGSNAFDCFPPETAARRRANLDEVCRTGKTKFDEDTRNGGYFALNYYPVRDENGKVRAVVVFAADISARKKMEEAIKESELRYRMVADFTSDWEFWVMPDGTFRYISPSCEKISGYTPSEFHADPELMTRIIHPDDLNLYESHTHRLSAQGIPEPIDFRILTKTGEYRWIAHVCQPVYDLAGNALGHRASNRDITERKQMEDQVRQLAFYDALTKLPNRRLLHDRLSQAMAASKRAKRYCALMFLDLDNFKSLNDTHGHEVGDLLLIEVADRLKKCVREQDTVARLGGDEFVVMLSDLDEDKAESISRTEIVAEKIRVALAELYVLNIQRAEEAETTVEHHCTASIGVVMFVDHEASQDDILKWADMAMYQAKEAGRNLIRFHDRKTG